VESEKLKKDASTTGEPEENPRLVVGDLLDQPVEVIVNAWNRNILPWWLLLPQGVSGSIKRRAGKQPFREVARHGSIPLGGAVFTSAGSLPYAGIIHVAGINLLWRASEGSIRASVRSALKLAAEKGFTSIAFPVIGAGSGSFSPQAAKEILVDEIRQSGTALRVIVAHPKGWPGFASVPV
jgi:O-acetyl-ADP-ribose deacetylase (regulator of RNase III)